MKMDPDRLRRYCVIVGIVALALCVAWAFHDRAGFFRGYLAAWLFLVAISAGGMANLMIHDLTGGRWGAVLRPPLEAATGAMPWLAVLGIPLAFGLPDLFAWARPDVADPVVLAKQWYLNPVFFLARAAIVLATWSVLAVALRRDWRRRADPAPPSERRLSIVGLLLYFVTVTVAAVDWIGSLVPQWYSSALGLRVGVAQTMAGFVFAVCMAAFRGELDRTEAAPRDRQDMGNLLLMFAMTWAYIAYTEFLIIWAEDIPHETSWFLPRGSTSWRWLAVAVFAFNFGIPVLGTLFRAIKCSPALLAGLCALVLFGQWLDAVWLVVPSLVPGGFHLGVPEVLATIGLGGVWLALTMRTLAESPPLRAVAASLPDTPT